MRTIKTLLASLVVLLGLVGTSHASIPWGAIDVQTSATPTCVTFATDPVCILNITANITTAPVLTGGTVGSFATLIWQQDGTGARTVKYPTNVGYGLVGGSAPAIPVAINAYTVWVLEVTATNTYVLQATYDNADLSSVFSTTQTSPGTAVAPGAYLLGPTIVAPGVSVSNGCLCINQTLPATWQTGIIGGCLPESNAVQCVEFNPTAGTITPTAVVVNVRLVK